MKICSSNKPMTVEVLCALLAITQVYTPVKAQLLRVHLVFQVGSPEQLHTASVVLM